MQHSDELRLALTVDDFGAAVAFYRDVVGLSVQQEWPPAEGKGILFAVPHATLEIIDQEHAAWVDSMEVGRRVSGPVRLALRFKDLDAAVLSARGVGAPLLHEPVETPWKDRNARLLGPGGLQVTFFQAPSSGR
jgi:lactoylglutathione lyase